MTDDKPMTFEEALNSWYHCPQPMPAPYPNKLPLCEDYRRLLAAHAREVEAARREERKACIGLIRCAQIDPVQGGLLIQAILARGKPEVARPPMPRSSKYKCLRCGEWFPLDELEAHQTCGGTLAPAEKP